MGNQPRAFLNSGFAIVAALLFLASCGKPEEPRVQAHLSGRVVIAGEADSTDFSAFEVVVTSNGDDTLAFATTDTNGDFATDVVVEQRGIYPLSVRRYGTLMARSEYIVGDGDTSTFNLAVPSNSGVVIIKSSENSAWAAYRNAKATYNANVLRLARMQTATAQSVDDAARAAASILWSIQDVYPQTMAAELAASESLLMLESREDSVVVERAKQIHSNAIGYLNVLGAARRSISRLEGVDRAVEFLDSKLDNVEEVAARVAISTEAVLALQDSSRYDDALDRARKMQRTFNGGDYDAEISSLVYELESLRPGDDLPAFVIRTQQDDSLGSSDIGDQTAIVELFDPLDESFQADLAIRDSLIALARRKGLDYHSITTNADHDINEAFFTRDGHGEFRHEPVNVNEVIELFNVGSQTRRFLVKNNKILGKYDGRAVQALYSDLMYGNLEAN